MSEAYSYDADELLEAADIDASDERDPYDPGMPEDGDARTGGAADLDDFGDFEDGLQGEAEHPVILEHRPPGGALVTVDGLGVTARIVEDGEGFIAAELDGVVHRAAFALHAAEGGRRIDLVRPVGRVSLFLVDPLTLRFEALVSERLRPVTCSVTVIGHGGM